MKFLILGAGRQGTVIAADILSAGDHEVTVADRNASSLESVQRRFPGITVRIIDVNELWDVARALSGMDVCVSAVPYFYNLILATTAVENGVHFCDLGGSGQIVMKQLRLDAQARENGVALIPDCGLSPGLTNILAAHVISQLDRVDSLEIRAGGVPGLLSANGLLNRYLEPAGVVKNGQFLRLDSLTESEPICFEGYPDLETFYANGGLSTLPETYAARVKNIRHKTIGHKGLASSIRAIVRDPRFKSRGEIGAYLESAIPAAGPDVVLVRVTGIGSARVQYEVIEGGDPETGFSAMMRVCGVSAAIIAELLAAGRFEPGAHVLEKVVSPDEFVSELAKRGIRVRRSLEAENAI